MCLQLVALLVNELDLAPRSVLLDFREWVGNVEPRALLRLVVDLVQVLWDHVRLALVWIVQVFQVESVEQKVGEVLSEHF